MKHLLSVSTATAALAFGALAACGALFGKGPHVPSAYQGTTEITVTNGGDKELCAFMLFAGAATADNWLGTGGKVQNLAPHASRAFAIKPGTYHINGAFCEGGTFLAAIGTYGEATKTIEGPTQIVMGPLPVDRIPGEEALVFTKFFYPNGGGGGGGEEQATDQPAEEPATSSSESSSSSSSSSSEEAKPLNCKPSGATCDQSYQCCSDACITHSPNDYCR